MFGQKSTTPQISAKELKKLIDDGGKITILDVRTEDEVSRDRIANSINIPLDRIQEVEKKISDKNTNIYVYCLSGSRSSRAVDELQKMGYKNSCNIQSGLLAWRASKYPLISS